MHSLSLVKKIKFFLFGIVYLEHRQHTGWKEPIPFYLLRCKKHGVYEDRTHGFDETFLCPECLKEEWS